MTYMMNVEKIIFYLLCGFSLSIGINGFIADQFIGVALFFTILRAIKGKIHFHLPREYGRPLGVFFLGLFLLLFFSGDIRASFGEYWRFLNRMIPFFIAILFVKQRKQVFLLLSLLLISLSMNNAYAIYEGLHLALKNVIYIRAAGIDIPIIELAGYLMILLPMVLIAVLEKSLAVYRKYFVFVLFLGVMALLFNGTRTAWVLMGLILPGILCIYSSNLKKVIALMLAVFIGGGILAYHVPFLHDRLKSFADIEHVSNRGHYFIAVDTLRMIGDRPLFGVGLGRFQKVYNEQYISRETKAAESFVTHAHNNTLAFMAQVGIFGAILYWLLFGSFLYRSGRRWIRSRRPEDLMFFVITLATVLQGITEYSFGLHQTMKLYFFMLALYLIYRFALHSEEV